MDEQSLFLTPMSGQKASLFRSLRALEPELGYYLLSSVHEREDARLRHGSADRRARVAERLAKTKIFSGEDLDRCVEAYCAYLSRGQLITMFSMIFMGRIDHLIHYDGLDELHERRARGDKIVLVPFHVRQWGALMTVVLGTGIPVTIIGHLHASSLHGMFNNIVDDADVDVLAATDKSVLLQCRSALRSGRTLIWFPELYVGSVAPESEVTFLGEAVPMAHTLPRFCLFEGAISIPCYVYERSDDRLLGAVFGSSIPPPTSRDGASDYLRDLCQFYENMMQRDLSHLEWHGWYSDNDPLRLRA